MTNSITIDIDRDNGETLTVSIEAEWADPKGNGLEHALLYSIWVNVDDPQGFIEVSDDGQHWTYGNGDLSPVEQKQVIDFLKAYKESDWNF